MNGSLYEIGQEFLTALNSIVVDEDTGEITDFGAIDALSAQFDDKAEAVACHIKNLAALVTGLKAEEAALSDRRKKVEKRVEGLKRYLTNCFDSVGRDNIETPRAKISFRKSTAVLIEDEAAIPSDYIVQTVTTKPDKAAIKEAIKDGKEVAGAALVENRNIQIK